MSPGTEMELFNVDDPAGNHNGGNIAFGPDGYLYIGIGDGGGGNDQFPPIGNGQRLTTLLGKMLRIDVTTPATAAVPYAIPSTNPFAGNARCNVNGTGTDELSGDLCLRIPQSVALEFRSRSAASCG